MAHEFLPFSIPLTHRRDVTLHPPLTDTAQCGFDTNQAGLAATRARGRLGGRRPIPLDDPRVVTAKRLHKDRSLSIDQICKTMGISRPTFYRYLALSDPTCQGDTQRT